jgi:hypothetical protein
MRQFYLKYQILEEAMKLPGRKSIWFYNMRMSGQLNGTNHYILFEADQPGN